MNNLRKLTVLSVVMAFAMLAGCATDNPPPGMAPAEAKAEYHAEQAQFSLPEGSSWPEREYDADTRFGPGTGKVDAAAVWWCAWEGKYVKASTDAQRAEALATLEKVKNTYMYTTAMAPETRKETDEILAKAKLGDPSGLSQEYAANCA